MWTVINNLITFNHRDVYDMMDKIATIYVWKTRSTESVLVHFYACEWGLHLNEYGLNIVVPPRTKITDRHIIPFDNMGNSFI